MPNNPQNHHSNLQQIDLNADLGEGCGLDEQIIPLISSANISCAWHAGDVDTMTRAVTLAREHGVAIGAHPSFPDRENFGRKAMELPPETLYAGILYQLGALDAICKAQDANMVHVKAHGALYNQAAKDKALAKTLVKAIKDFNPLLKVMALAGGELLKAAKEQGLETISEAFADRAYLADGTLAPRSMAGSVLSDPRQALEQIIKMLTENKISSIDGKLVKLNAESLCLHGDNAHALEFARSINDQLETLNIKVAAKK